MSEAFYSLDNNKKHAEATLYSFYEECIYFFSFNAAYEIVCRHEKATDDYYDCLYHGIINLSERELLNKIENTHAEYVVPFITVFLWKQRLGLISSKKKIDIDTDSISSLFGDYVTRRIHRMMSMSGYDDIYLKQPPNEALKDTYNSYLAVVHDLIDFHNKEGYDDDDYFSLLLDFLGVMGVSNIKKYELYEEILLFVDYIFLNFDKDERLSWIHVETFAFFLYCINYNTETSFDCFEKMIARSDKVTILTEVLGIKLFGGKACKILKKQGDNYSYFGDFDNFCRLVMLE